MSGNMLLLFPALWPMAGAIISYLLGREDKERRNIFVFLVTLVEFAVCLGLFIPVLRGKTFSLLAEGVCGMGLYLRLDGFSALYGLIAAFMWMMTMLFSREYMDAYHNRNRYYLFNLMTCGATIGVFLSGDLFTAFVFFELLSFTSYVMVIHEEDRAALKAGETYIAVAVIGGMVMLMGLFLLYHLCGTLRMDELLGASRAVENRTLLYTAGALILFGFGAKAGMFPLHIWLPKAHPVAPAPASALLSGILTKVGVYGILCVSCNVFLHDPAWGNVTLAIGLVTMLLGAVLAVFSVNLKRTLACSSMSQIGFILVGVGMQGLLGEENGLAVWGTVLHMVNHSLFKLVLFMCAGVIVMNCHKLNLNDIRGYGKDKRFLKLAFLSGSLGIMGVPLFSGYISKTLLHESIVEYIEVLKEAGQSALLYQAAEWIFLFSGGLTVAYMTKLFVCIFVEEPGKVSRAQRLTDRRYLSDAGKIAIGAPAVLFPLFGLLPQVFMNGMGRLSESFMNGKGPAHIAYFSLVNLRGAVISIGIGALVYFLFIRKVLMKKQEDGTMEYLNLWPSWLDLENLIYRPVVQVFLPRVFGLISEKVSGAADWVIQTAVPFVVDKTALLIDKLFAAVEWCLTVPAPFVGTVIARALSSVTDFFTGGLLRTVLKKRPIPQRKEEDYEPGDTLPGKEWDTAEDIMDTMSFGLVLFGIGLVLVLVYVIMRGLG